ncbi:DMSO/TMAO reductase YedYZ molybdopterin-dependent catalytic subunit [Kitasatospora sp. GP82]|nr:DMSO/TMAO reductase YedYZ molybdopterin-dependent catalytic subunit [Kitasatospora sp. GP82]
MNEFEYDRKRRQQWLAGEARAEGVEHRTLLRMLAAGGVLSEDELAPTGRVPAEGTPEPEQAGTSATPVPGIVKPLPPEWFIPRGTNAEMRWDTLRDSCTGFHIPTERFFIRNHTSTPVIDPDAWRLTVTGSGLRGPAVDFDLAGLRRLPATGLSSAVECAGNGRSYFESQQQQNVPGTPWTLGGIGVARWRGVRLAEVLRRAGLRPEAVDVMPIGLDPEYVTTDGQNLGHVRRPLPIGKALDDVLLAYEMNGAPLAADHGAPVRLVVPGWVGIASIKWIGTIEVAAEPLYSPWNTDFYRMFGPDYPPDGGAELAEQVVKSVFELAHDAVLARGRCHRLHGRSWSGAAAIREVEVSTDGGAHWSCARLRDLSHASTWTRWTFDWRPQRPGPYELLARASDQEGNIQPPQAVFNREGYLFGATVVHPVIVV